MTTATPVFNSALCPQTLCIRIKHALRCRRLLARSVMLAMLLSVSSFSFKAEASTVMLDFTFGTSGVVKTQLSGADDLLYDLALQPDGKIIAVGRTSGYDVGLARYNSNGSLDSSFGASGIVRTHIGGLYALTYARAVALQPDGKIVVAGYTSSGSSYDFVLARYNLNGALDTTFGAGGVVTTDFAGSWDYGEDVLIQPDGKIVAIGRSYYINSQPYYDFSVARYNSSGTLDASFGNGGKATANFGYGDEGYSGALLANGQILVGGLSRNVGTLDDLAIVRFNSNGSIDTTFGTNGRATVDFANYDVAYKIAIQPDGKIVAAGGAVNQNSSFSAMIVARFNADGGVDSGFGVGGKQTTSFSGGSSEAQGLAIQPDGKIIVAGYVRFFDFTSDFALARYNTDGSPDTVLVGSGIGGQRIFPGDSNDFGHAMVMQPDGKLVVGGEGYTGFGNPPQHKDFVLARYQTTPRAPGKPYDFDGDGKADIGVFRPSNGTWYVRLSSSGALLGFQWGTNGDMPEPADFDGESRNDFVVFRNGLWFLVYSTDLTMHGMQFGTTGDIPVAADYDGDARADFAVYRPSNGTWYILNSSNGQFQAIQLGTNGDKPVPGDYNGDGLADIAVWRPSNGTWYTSLNPNTNYDAFAWGHSGDIPVPGDYDRDGKNDRAIFRPSTATWWIHYSSNGGYLEQPFGAGTDLPVPADYDGDGKTNIAVFRPSTGYWYTSLDVNTNYGGQLWGQAGDIAIETSNVP